MFRPPIEAIFREMFCEVRIYCIYRTTNRHNTACAWTVSTDKSLVQPGRKDSTRTEDFWCSYILFIIIIGGILVLFIYITRLASNEIFSPSNKIHREVGRSKDLSAPLYSTGVLISPYPDQEGNKLQRQKILSFIYPIYNHNWRNISTIYIYNKTSIKRNILSIKQNTSESMSG